MKGKENYSGFKGLFKFFVGIFSWTALVILILLALFLAYYTISTKLCERRGVEFNPFISLYTIVSGSMEPNINISDVVVDMRVDDPKDIKVGDVITFVSTSSISKNMIITHRVVEVSQTEKGFVYKTKGDNNLSADSAPAEFDKVIGKVVLRIPKLGNVQNFLASQGGWLVAIVIPAFLIIVSDLLKIFKLTGVKNKIEKINENDKIIRKEKAHKEELRKEAIKKRLQLDKNENEPDPIVTKKRVRIVVADKAPVQATKQIKNNSSTRVSRSSRNSKKKKINKK